MSHEQLRSLILAYIGRDPRLSETAALLGRTWGVERDAVDDLDERVAFIDDLLFDAASENARGGGGMRRNDGVSFMHYCRAVEEAPLSAPFLVDRAAVYFVHGQLKLAEEDTRRAITIDPTCTRAIALLSAVEWHIGGKDSAEEVLVEGLRRMPGNAALMENLNAVQAGVKPCERSGEMPLDRKEQAECEARWFVRHLVMGERAGVKQKVMMKQVEASTD